MSDDRLAEIRARVDAATPARWWSEEEDVQHRTQHGEWCDFHTANIKADAAFIAHARDDVPWLLAEVERLSAHADVLWRAGLAAHLRVERAEAQVAAVKALHCRGESRCVGTIDADGALVQHGVPSDDAPTVWLDEPAVEVICSACRTDWPCATRRAMEATP
jgi:hypothetical protein